MVEPLSINSESASNKALIRVICYSLLAINPLSFWILYAPLIGVRRSIL